jgi:hypothetical protein
VDCLWRQKDSHSRRIQNCSSTSEKKIEMVEGKCFKKMNVSSNNFPLRNLTWKRKPIIIFRSNLSQPWMNRISKSTVEIGDIFLINKLFFYWTIFFFFGYVWQILLLFHIFDTQVWFISELTFYFIFTSHFKSPTTLINMAVRAFESEVFTDDSTLL